MAKKVTIKKGDVFEVSLKNDKKGYFQFIGLDLTQLNSEVIRVFQKRYHINESPNIQNIVNDDVDFHAHCIIRAGLMHNVWNKYGNGNIDNNIEEPMFRDTDDITDISIKVSNNWFVWKINSQMEDVGLLNDNTRKYDIGLVINPYGIKDMIEGVENALGYPQ